MSLSQSLIRPRHTLNFPSEPSSKKMFQVAPQSFAPSRDRHHRARESLPSTGVQLPRTLARPQFIEVKSAAIVAVCPELAGAPPEYVRQGLRQNAGAMLAGLSALNGLPNSIHKGQIPASISVAIRQASGAAYSTHILAISNSKSSDSSAFLFPIHGAVVASHCAQLPPLPASAPRPTHGAIQQPILPIALPSPTAFSIIHSFMYTHRLDAVLRALFPMPSGFLDNLSHDTVQATLASPGTLHQLSAYLFKATGGSLQILTTHAAHVKELWQDMVALGLYSPDLWDTVDLAWEIILGALTTAASQCN